MSQVVPLRSTPSPAPVAAPGRPVLGDILVRNGRVAPAALALALTQQQEQNVPLGRILVVNGAITGAELTEALSEQARVGAADLEAQPPEDWLLAGVDPYRCLELEAIPWRVFGGQLVVAIASQAQGRAAIEAFAREGMPTTVAIASADSIRRAIARRFGAAMVARAERRCPERLSCRSLLATRMTARKAALLAAIALAVALAPVLAFELALLWIVVSSLLTTGLRLVALFTRARLGPADTAGEAPRLVDYRKLPPVSLLVPLKGEAAIAGELVAALRRMEYPAPLLDIKLVLEAGDTRTLEAVEAAGLPPTMEVVIVPAGTVQTKPRAMNYALPFCRGEIVGVYDAEDRPDPRQIRHVVHHLMQAPPEVACVQGYLDFYNGEESWLARCFTIEYAVWFRVVLRGVQRMGLPIPLGGTTVFFRRRALEEIGAWDAHNVTEDADLGMRLHRFGYRCEMIATTTEEEACSDSLRRWIRQRSRWLKGYAITWATHMRTPRTLWRELGPAGFLGFQVLFLGGLTSYLAMPLFWLLWGASFGLGVPLWDEVGRGPILALLAVLWSGQAVTLAAAAVALADAGRTRMLPWVVTLGLYWPLGALAAYRAVAELFYAPFHWHKTEHGHHRNGR